MPHTDIPLPPADKLGYLLTFSPRYPPPPGRYRGGMWELIEQSRPPDADVGDMIEQAWLVGRITELQAALADAWARQFCADCGKDEPQPTAGG